jgi:SAM-dependent methyltransferase
VKYYKADDTVYYKNKKMAKINAFESGVNEYEEWFEKYHWVYESELDAVRKLLPGGGIGVEIGVGTGRFAERLGITFGIEPSGAMRAVAQKRGIRVIDGVAEALPLRDDQYDYVLLVTTICFLDSLEEALKESNRILKSNGKIIIGFIDKNSSLGKKYEKGKHKSKFYKDAIFYSAEGIAENLTDAGFYDFTFVQTIFNDPEKITSKEPVKEGYGEGSFVVISGKKADFS